MGPHNSLQNPTGVAEYDVAVIGGGPAGLAVSIAVAIKGLRTILYDPCQPPQDKCCGEGLLPESLRTLDRLGVTLPFDGTAPLNGIRFVSSDESAQAEFPLENGRGVRRTILHQALAERAQQAGVDLQWGIPAVVIDNNTVAAADRIIKCSWIVGCDGSQSAVRSWAGLDGGTCTRVRFGFRRHFRRTPWTSKVEVHWGEHMQAYVTPVAPQEVGVAVLSSDPQLRLEDALPAFPELQEKLNGYEYTSTERGATTGNRLLVDTCRGNVALAGDASGTVDAITGAGLGLAFEEALALADAIATGDLEPYRQAHRKILGKAIWKARFLQTMDRWPDLAVRTIRVFAAKPELFRRMVAMHVSNLQPIEQLRLNAELGWHILKA